MTQDQQALEASEGWEYAPLFNMKFHAKESKMDLVRRRRWHRKMKPVNPEEVTPCTFSFDDPVSFLTVTLHMAFMYQCESEVKTLA